MNVASSLISLAVGLVIPALVSLLTRVHASDGLKAMLTAMLAAVSGGLNGALSAVPHGWHQWEQILWQIGLAWIAAGVTYLTGYKPTGVTLWIHRKTEPFGLPLGPAPAGAPALADAGYTRFGLLLGSVVAGMILGLIFQFSTSHVVRVLIVATALAPALVAVAVLVLVKRRLPAVARYDRPPGVPLRR